MGRHDAAMTAQSLTCVRCGLPVERNTAQYETFERMHWVCFHYEHEHGLNSSPDPDIACPDPNCPARACDDQAQPDWFTNR
jgi:hypothetical protein